MNDKPLQMRVSPEFLAKLDAWRRSQNDLPGRSEAVRRLVEKGLAADQLETGASERPLTAPNLRRMQEFEHHLQRQITELQELKNYLKETLSDSYSLRPEGLCVPAR
jgi:hypothetical protein